MTQQIIRTQQGVKDRGGGKKELGQGPLAAIEAADVAALAGAVASSGPLAAIEASDAAVLVGTVALSGTLSAIETTDIFAGTGSLVAAPEGILAATEAGDGAVFAGGIVGTALLAATEAADAFTAAGVVIDAGAAFGPLVATEAADTAEAVGEVAGEVAPPVFEGGGGAWPPPRPYPVEGAGYGILPELEGEAHGVVVATSTAAAMLPSPAGEAVGSTGAGGQGEARLGVKAAASGVRGATGTVAARIGFGVAGSGAAAVRGKGTGVIGNIEGRAIGRHDDDEAAVVWLLAA